VPNTGTACGRLRPRCRLSPIEMHVSLKEVQRTMIRDEILENLRAFRSFERDPDRQMPDPLAYGDVGWLLHHAPKLSDLLALIERQHIVNPAGVSWGARKHDRSARNMTLANPWAEIWMRLTLAPAGKAIVDRQTDLVLASRAELRASAPNRPAALTTRSHRRSHGIYRQLRQELIRRDPPVGLQTDIHKFYPSVAPSQQERALRNFMSTAVSASVRTMLEKSALGSGCTGLPIGPESSAWLANIILHDADRVLEAFPGIEALRWMDDLYLMDGVPSLVEQSFIRWEQAIGEFGLSTSQAKTKRSWKLGISGAALMRQSRISHGDIAAARSSQDYEQLAGRLLDELRGRADAAWLNHLLGSLCRTKAAVPPFSGIIVELMLDDPTAWERSCPRAVPYLGRCATARQREKTISTAIDLHEEGFPASEQVAALCRAASDLPDRCSIGGRGAAARLLLQLARQSACVPVRMWARTAAQRLDPHYIRRQTIDAGEFGDLHPFEQRASIMFADPRRHRSWLRQQHDSGRWPATAAYRMALS